MAELQNKLQELTRQLTEVEREILERAKISAQTLKPDEELLDVSDLTAFKNALDRARHVVWPCLLAAEQHAEANVLYSLQLYRMQRVRDMLGAFQHDMQKQNPNDVARLFLAEVHRMTAKHQADA